MNLRVQSRDTSEGVLQTMRIPLLVLATGMGGAVAVALAASQTSPLVGLLAVLALAGGVGIVLYPRFALCVLCFSLPFERIGRFTNDTDAVTISISRVVGVAALVALLLWVAVKREKLHFGWAVWLYAGFAFVGLLSNAWTATPSETFKDSLRIVGNLLFFFYVINAIRDYKTAKLAISVWLCASFLAGFYSLSDYLVFRSAPLSETEVGLTAQRSAGTVVSDGSESRSLGMNVIRMFGTTSHPALFGLNNIMVLPFIFWAIRRAQGVSRMFLWLLLLVPAACILLSNTRAVILLSMFTVAFAVVRRLLKVTPQLCMSLLAVGAVTAALIPSDVYRRSFDLSLYTAQGGEAVRSRLKLLSASMELLRENFITGIGVGDQTTLVNMIKDENTGFLSTDGLRASAHNEFIWILVEVGVFGYALHFGFVWLVTAASFKAARRLRDDPEKRDEYFFLIACQGVLIGVLIWAFQSAPFHYPLKGWWLTAAISYVLWNRGRDESSVKGQPGPIDPVYDGV